MNSRKPLIYLASPYTHPNPLVQEIRAQQAAAAAAALKRMGLHIFAPIPHGHALAKYGLPGDYAFWKAFSRNMLSRCDAMLVLMIDGYDTSAGIKDEVDYFVDIQHGIHYYAGLDDILNHTLPKAFKNFVGL